MSHRGFSAILIIIAVLVATSIGGFVYLKQQNILDDTSLSSSSEKQAASNSALPKPSVVPNSTSQHKISSTLTPTKTPTQRPTTKPTITPTPTPAVRTVTASGFVYEDRNDDGIFNSDDAKLPNMHIKYSDSDKPGLAWDYFTIQDGAFTVSLNVRGNLIVDPQTYNNFRPRNGALRFSSSSSDIAIPFRSASAPAVNQGGVLEGDIFNDTNRNGSRDAGENGIYFYKLYLRDENGNNYNTVEGAQATDTGGHFKYENLPLGKTFSIVLSNPTGDYTINQTTYNFTITNTVPTISNITVPVIKN